jgi:peptide chain release factor 1
VNVREELEQKLARFEELERQLADPAVLSDPARIQVVAREHGTLTRIATKVREFKKLLGQIHETQAMATGSDEDMKELALAELPELKLKREAIWQELLDSTIGGEDANRLRCVFEIRAGTGGEEAALFARDLFEMYKRHCESRGWKAEVLEMSPAEHGGFKEITMALEGEGVYREMQYESGGHRVQRVPETEAKGRIHTSMVTVVVMAEPEDVEVNLKPEDYRKDLYCASGPGGQHVNKTESAVRLTHHETGIVVAMQDERSQHKNFAKAIRLLKSRIYEHKRLEEQKRLSTTRKLLAGSGDRSERIRTYNFPDNRVTDHRINFTLYKLDQVIAGNMQPLTDALIEYDRQQLRGDMGDME